MIRNASLASLFVVGLAACAGASSGVSDGPPPPPDNRPAPMTLNCGGETFRLFIEGAGATAIDRDGVETELRLLPPPKPPEPAVATYTNGMLTFTKSGGRDTPTVIRFARGRMAFRDCAIAQH